MARVLIILLAVIVISIILEVHANNNFTNTDEILKENNDLNTTTSSGNSRKISKRHLHTIVLTGFPGGKSNGPSRGRPSRNKRPRKPKPKRPQRPINHDHDISLDYDEIDFKKQLQEERRNRYNKQKERLQNYEGYLSHPDLGNLGHVFNEDEIKDLFLTTDFEYNKIVRDYNKKFADKSRPSKNKRPAKQRGKYESDFFKDSEGIYDFSETANPDLRDTDPFYKQHSKFKKNDATLQYELENLKDFGIHQNSYGEYQNQDSSSETENNGVYTYTIPPELNNENAMNMIKHFEDVNYTLELLKTYNKTKSQNHADNTKNEVYPNHAPTYSSNYGYEYSFDKKPTNSNPNFTFDFKTHTFPSDIPSFTTNYANGYNFDTKTTPTKFSIPEWNVNVQNGGDYVSEFDKKGNPFPTIDTKIGGDLEQNKDFSVDIVKQFYEMNNFHTPGYSAGITVTAKPMSYDQTFGATMNYEEKDPWKIEDNGWKVIDPHNGGTQTSMDISHPIIVPVPHPYPVRVPVTKPVAVPVVKEIKVPVEKEVPYPVVKNVPYPIEKPVPVRVEKQVTVTVPKPYPIKIPVVKNIFHHSHESRPHVDEYDSDSEQEHHHNDENDYRGEHNHHGGEHSHREPHESWDEDVTTTTHYEASEEESVPKESRRHVWRNGRPKKSKRKNNFSQFEDYEERNNKYRPKKRNPSGTMGKNRGNKNNNRENKNNGRNRPYNRRKKNANRPRPGNRTKRLRITRRQSDD